MISVAAWYMAEGKALRAVNSNDEATIYYAEEPVIVTGYAHGVKLDAGQYITVSRKETYGVFGDSYFYSTQGSYKRCRKAWMKYSPRMVKRLQAIPN